MGARGVPERLTWIVGLLDVRPGHRVLEIGCGRGVALDLVCDRLDGSGHGLGLDRSAAAVAAARERYARSAGTGLLSFVEGSLEALGERDLGRFDRIFSMNVNVFWTKPDSSVELALVRNALAPEGTVHLGWEAVGAARAAEILGRVLPALERAGFDAEAVMSPTSQSLVCARGALG